MLAFLPSLLGVFGCMQRVRRVPAARCSFFIKYGQLFQDP